MLSRCHCEYFITSYDVCIQQSSDRSEKYYTIQLYFSECSLFSAYRIRNSNLISALPNGFHSFSSRFGEHQLLQSLSPSVKVH